MNKAYSESVQQLMKLLNQAVDNKDINKFTLALYQLSKNGDKTISINIFQKLILCGFSEGVFYLLNNDLIFFAPRIRTEVTLLHDALRNKDLLLLKRAIQILDQLIPESIIVSYNIFPLLIRHEFTEAIRLIMTNEFVITQRLKVLHCSELEEGMSHPLVSACLESKQEITELLLEHNVSVPPSFLHIIADSGTGFILKNVLEKLRPKYRSIESLDINSIYHGIPAIWRAIVKGNKECAKILLSYGARIDQHCSISNKNLFHMLTADADHPDMLIWLLSSEFREEFPTVSLPDINEGYEDHDSLLKVTQDQGKPEFTEALLTHGLNFNLNFKNAYGIHSDPGTITMESNTILSVNRVNTCCGLYLMGIVIFPNYFPNDIKYFFAEQGVTIRIREGKLIMTGFFFLQRESANNFLIQKYGSLILAYLSQAEQCYLFYEQYRDKKYLTVIEALMKAALKCEMNILEKSRVYLHLADFYYFSKMPLEAIPCYFKAKSVASLCKDNLFTDLHSARLNECVNFQPTTEDLLKSGSLRIVAGGAVKHHSNGLITATGRLNFNGIIVRNIKDSSEIKFLSDCGISVELQPDGLLSFHGNFRALPISSILAFMIEKHRGYANFCLMEGVACLKNYHLRGEEQEQELADAEWFLNICAYTTKKPNLKIKALLNLGSLELAKHEPCSALAYFRFALAEGRNATYDASVQNMLSEISKYQGLPKTINDLGAKNILNSEMVTDLFNVPYYALIISSGLQSLKNAGILTSENIRKLFESPSEALWIAERLGGKPQAKDAVARDFVRIRGYARLLLLGGHSGPAPDYEKSSFYNVPDDVKAKILSYTHSGTLSEQVAIRIALQALSEKETDAKNRFTY